MWIRLLIMVKSITLMIIHLWNVCSRLYDKPIDMSHNSFWEKHLLLLPSMQLTRQTSDLNVFRLRHELTTEKKH